MSLGALRLLFAIYVLALCALAISDPSFERGGALFMLTLGVTILMWHMDVGIVHAIDKDDTDVEEDDSMSNEATE